MDIKKALDWLLYSSANPNKFSLTLKSGLPFLVILVSIFNLDLTGSDLEKLIEAIAAVVFGAGTIYGLARKVYSSFR